MNAFLNWLSMGGYGLYVWSSYGIVIAVLATQLIKPWLSWRKISNRNTHVK
jgi:heme exporter protein D